MPPRSLPITSPPTPKLQASAEKVGEHIQKDVESMKQGLTTPLKYVQFEQLVKDYEESFYKENETLLREFPSSPQGNSGLVLLQAGKLPIEASCSAVTAITVLKIGKLESEIHSHEGQKPIDWGIVGSVIILPGNSMINSSGEGRLVCFFQAIGKA